MQNKVSSLDSVSLTVRELKNHVYTLSHEFGDRSTRKYHAMQQTAGYIADRLEACGLDVTEQSYHVVGRPVSNLIAELAGTDPTAEILIVGAHYDTCDNPGADDNASAVAVLIEVAKKLSASKTRRKIRFVAFVNEEPPYFQTEYMGSKVYANKLRENGEKIYLAVILEMLGYYSDEPHSQKIPLPLVWKYPSTGNFLLAVGDKNSSAAMEKLAGMFRRSCSLPLYELTKYSFIQGVDSSDHWSFWENGYPAIMITDTSYYRNPYYHTAGDTYEKLDYNRMAQAVEGNSAAILELAK
ncbi:MAG: M28 family peptidase [Candidatus Wallbacteria bacterium]|nr:M28 family peptidase [Candidatus Wallbacteria bacterium]